MPDLQDGETVEIKGTARTPYVISIETVVRLVAECNNWTRPRFFLNTPKSKCDSSYPASVGIPEVCSH